MNRYIFISGIFRSGTTLMSEILNSSPEVFIGWQPFFFFFKYLREKAYKEYFGIKLSENVLMGTKIHWRNQNYQFNDLLKNLHISDSELIQINKRILEETIKKVELNDMFKMKGFEKYIRNIESGISGEILTQYFYNITKYAIEVKKKEKCMFVGVKEVFCEEFFIPLIKYYGNKIKIIHMMRDPRSIVASRNYGTYYEITKRRYPLDIIIEFWNNSFEFYLNLKKFNKSYIMIKYENLVNYLKKEISKINEFLGNKEIINLHLINKKNFVSNSSFYKKNHGKIHPYSINKWREVLSKKEICYIESKLIKKMKKVGYTPFC